MPSCRPWRSSPPRSSPPIMFQAELVERSRANRRTIVLPEPEDDRVLRAADAILRRGIADLVLLGDETTVRARATELGLDIAAARVVATNDPRAAGEVRRGVRPPAVQEGRHPGAGPVRRSRTYPTSAR